MTSHSRSRGPQKGHTSHSGKEFSRGPRKTAKAETATKHERVSIHSGSKVNQKNSGAVPPHKDLTACAARPAGAQPAALPDTNGMRLNKAIAASGLCSRRKADELIFSGRVTVNGVTEANPARQVLPNDALGVDGRPLNGVQDFCYLMLYKPVQVVCTVHDPEGRPTVMDYLPGNVRGLRLYPVGRLDYFSEGLLLLTNDGQLAQRLTHPSHHQPKTYEVLVRGSVSDAALAAMRRGMRLAEGEVLMPVEVEASFAKGRTLLRMVLHQGLNRQIRRMCRDLDLTILHLKRVAQGPLELGSLTAGRARELSAAEIKLLKESVSLHEVS